MAIKSIEKMKNIAGKRIILRVDFNVPVKGGVILDDYKIRKTLPTIVYLKEKGAKLILITHLGEPTAGVFERRFSVAPLAKYLESLFKEKVKVCKTLESFETQNAVAKMKDGDIVFLENIRFEKGEKENSKDLAKKISMLGDIYVNDAFAVCHRAHASVVAIKKYLPSYTGLLLQNEIEGLEKAMKPKKPLVLIIGGAKIKTKIRIINNFKDKADRIIIGGALANDFLAAEGFEIGKSLVDIDDIKLAKKLKTEKFLLPVDVVVSTSGKKSEVRIRKLSEIEKGDTILDIGPKTIFLYAKSIRKANTIIWNGPMGKFELKDFKKGTFALAHEVGMRAKGRCVAVAGGGETVEALRMAKMDKHIDLVSTGGGAMLSYLGKEKMPGLL